MIKRMVVIIIGRCFGITLCGLMFFYMAFAESCNLFVGAVIERSFEKVGAIAQKVKCYFGDGNACYAIGDEMETCRFEIEGSYECHPNERAWLWFKRACERDVSRGCYMLAKNESDVDGKKRLLDLACTRGGTEACIELGDLEQNAPLNLEAARRAYGLVCKKEERLGCEKLAVLEERYGDVSEARRLYRFMCEEKKFSGLCSELGRFEEKQGNKEEALRVFRLACEKSEGAACERLEILEYEKGDLDTVREHYKHGCDLGRPHACYNLARLNEQQGDSTQSNRLFEIACHRGDRRGCLRLDCDRGDGSKCYELGYIEVDHSRIGQGDAEESLRLFRLACEKADFRGCHELGRAEEKKGNLVEAKRLYQLACAHRETSSCFMLESLQQKSLSGVEIPYSGKFYEMTDLNRDEKRFDNQVACEQGEVGACVKLGAVEGKNGELAEPELPNGQAFEKAEIEACLSRYRDQVKHLGNDEIQQLKNLHQALLECIGMDLPSRPRKTEDGVDHEVYTSPVY